MGAAPDKLTYDSYLRVSELVRLQVPRSSPPAHDELQFIVVHQVYELWFRLLLYEIRAIVGHLRAGEAGPAVWLLRRLVEIERVMTQQVQVMETMSPAKFLEFRDLLRPASGFQSVQFRELEFLSGLRDERYAETFDGTEADRARLREALKGPTLWTAFCDLLASRGLDVSTEDRQVEAVVAIYSDPKRLELHQLCEALVEYDEQFRVWRSRHALMAERMIGAKRGTGDPHTGRLVGRESFQEPGVRYLQSRVAARFFPVLWEARTRLGGESYGG